VGLVADPALPPLLHPRLAMDWDSWWLFEDLSVALLAQTTEPLARLGLAVEWARDWTVDRGPLSAHVRSAFARAEAAVVVPSPLTPARIAARMADVLAAVPEEWRAVASDAATPAEDQSGAARPVITSPVFRSYLSAHAFASWAAYQGEGLRCWFRAVETAACVLRHTRDAGHADLLLRHLADPDALVKRWNAAESASR